MTNYSQPFTVKSNARRAARKAGIDASKVVAFVKAGQTLYRFPLESEKPKAPKAAEAKVSKPRTTPRTGWAKKSAKKTKIVNVGPPTAAGKGERGLKFIAVAALLRRKGGASITEICKATGWLPHTARARISVDVSKHLAKGEIIQRRRHEDGVSVYSIIKDGEQLDLPGVTEAA